MPDHDTPRRNWFHRRLMASAPRSAPATGTARLGGDPAAELARDLDLVRRWQAGDHDAGLELLDGYASLIRVVAFRAGVRQTPDLLELHQDLVVRLLDRLPTLAASIESSFAGWLAWQVRDLAKRRRVRQASPAGAVVPGPEPVAADPREAAAVWEAIRNCQQRLPDGEREVFELRYIDGLSLPEAAARLASNTNAVAQSTFRLVRRMRACLGAQGFELRGAEA